MGLLTSSIRLTYLNNFRSDLEYKISLISSSRLNLVSSTDELLNVTSDLDPKSEWSLKEDVVIDYRAEINLDNDTFVVKNTYDGDRDPHDKNIAQTGQLWWPVPVMAVLGMALVVFGMLLTRREKHEK